MTRLTPSVVALHDVGLVYAARGALAGQLRHRRRPTVRRELAIVESQRLDALEEDSLVRGPSRHHAR